MIRPEHYSSLLLAIRKLPESMGQFERAHTKVRSVVEAVRSAADVKDEVKDSADQILSTWKTLREVLMQNNRMI